MFPEVTDDFKIMTNRAIEAFKNKQINLFHDAVKYIIRELKKEEIEDYVKYLYNKLNTI